MDITPATTAAGVKFGGLMVRVRGDDIMLYLMLAEGFEETEAIATLDVIRRAGIKIQTVGIGEDYFVTGSHNLCVKVDITIDKIEKEIMDGIIIPGGMPGTLNLQKSEKVTELIKYCNENKKLIAAICAAPMILGELGILKDRNVTCFPGYDDSLDGANVSDDYIVADGNIITARGAGVSIRFGGAIVDYFKKGEGIKILKLVQCMHV